MKPATEKVITMAVIVLAATSLHAQGREYARIEKAPPLREMQCVVKITADPDVIPLSPPAVEALLRSDGVAGEAAREMFAVEDSSAHPFFRLQALAHETGRMTDARDSNVPPATQMLLFDLSVHLPDEAPPRAREFSQALVERLGRQLDRAYAAHRDHIETELREAQIQQEAARKEFSEVVRQSRPRKPASIQPDTANEAVYRQLETVVDLPGLDRTMSIEKAIKLIRTAVDPPLNIVVLWRDLLDNADISPTHSIEIDGMRNVTLRTGLEAILSAISNVPLGFPPVMYVVRGGLLRIGTEDGLLPEILETRTYELPVLLRASGRTEEFLEAIRTTIAPQSWLKPSSEGPGATLAVAADRRLVVHQSPAAHRQIQELLEAITETCPVALPTDLSKEELEDRIRFLLSSKDKLDVASDRLEQQKLAIIAKREEADNKSMVNAVGAVIEELDELANELRSIQEDISRADANGPAVRAAERIMDKVAECAARCWMSVPGAVPVTDLRLLPVRGNPFFEEEERLDRQLSVAEHATRQIVRKLDELDPLLDGSRPFDPEVHRVRLAAQALAEADLRVHSWQTHLANLQSCTVVVLGALE